MEETIVSVGEKKRVKVGLLNFVTFVYCGMPNENTFSISFMEASGYQGYAMNLFYPKSMKTIRIKRNEFKVLDVNPEKITLQLIDKSFS